MNYYTETNYIDHDQLRTAGGKGRDDYFEVFRRCGLSRISIPVLRPENRISVFSRLKMERELAFEWRRSLKDIGEGDVLFIHSPVSEKFSGYASIIKEVKNRGCRIIDVVFDLETFFLPDYRNLARIKQAIDRKTEAALFGMSDAVICHNERMKERLVSIGVEEGKIVCVGVMDYLREEAPANDPGRFGKDKPVVFCGNLAYRKSGFVYGLPEQISIDLYGPGFTGRTTDLVRFKGVYPAIELMDIMQGSFGLVWDGSSCDTCTDACGEYLRYNNPHKMSHYLASGMPVLVWGEAAMAEYVTRERCGLTISSISEIKDILEGLTDEKYAGFRREAERVGSEMRRGMHIQKAVMEAIDLIG